VWADVINAERMVEFTSMKRSENLRLEAFKNQRKKYAKDSDSEKANFQRVENSVGNFYFYFSEIF
jgi:hypothetical protein